MVTKIHGGAKYGDEIGNLDYFEIRSVVPILSTGVDKCFVDPNNNNAPLVILPYTVRTGDRETIDFFTYTTQVEYEDDFKKQLNLNKLVQVISSFAQPIAMNSDSESVDLTTKTYPNLLCPTFGTIYTGTQIVYRLSFAIEHHGAFNFTLFFQDWRNYGINGRAIDDLDTGVVQGDDVFVTDTLSGPSSGAGNGAVYRNLIIGTSTKLW